ncbi:Phosphatidylinositol 3 and 4-kinase-like protein [Globisporangium polare]
MSSTAPIKICYEGEIHRFRLDVDNCSYDEILELFRRTFALKDRAFVVQCADADGDVVTITDEVEFRASLETFKDPHTKCFRTVRYTASDAREAAFIPSPVSMYAEAAVNTTTKPAQEEIIVAVETTPVGVHSDWEQDGQPLKKVHEEISPAELGVRIDTPEYKVDEGDWVAHSTANQIALIAVLKTVARLPASLVVSDTNVTSTVETAFISGFLRKMGEKNRSFKRRYMELNGTVLSDYKTTPEKHGDPLSRKDKESCERGNIDLERVSSLQPMESKGEPFGIHLATAARTWVIAAESEEDYHRWLRVLCSAVKFSAVHATYKRMFQLQEVRLQAITDVRLAISTGDTVGEIVEHIFNCYAQALDAAPLRPYDPTKFRLQITGSRDYLADRSRVMHEFAHVRECLLAKKTMDLTVIHESMVVRETDRHAQPQHPQ